jgi:hypothetical protein
MPQGYNLAELDFGSYDQDETNADESIDEEEWNRGVESFTYERVSDQNEDQSLDKKEYTATTDDS